MKQLFIHTSSFVLRQPFPNDELIPVAFQSNTRSVSVPYSTHNYQAHIRDGLKMSARNYLTLSVCRSFVFSLSHPEVVVRESNADTLLLLQGGARANPL